MKGQEGSVLITVMVVVSLLALSLTTVWRSSLYTRKSSALRVRVAQQRYSMEAFLRYGLALLAHNYAHTYSALSATHELALLRSDAWPLDDRTTWSLVLTGKRVDNGLELSVRARDVQAATVGCGVYTTTHGVDQHLVIDAWHEA